MVNYLYLLSKEKRIFFLEEGTYIPLLNDPKLITNEFLAKLKRATSTKGTTKILSKPGKQSNNSSNEEPTKRRSLKTVGIVATVVTNMNHNH
jgi:hypothetical protein